MAHLIDTSNARNNIAFVGETPWHGLGQRLTEGADLDTWTREAGLAWGVRRSEVEFIGLDNERKVMGDRHVLFRGDTGKPLGIVSADYKIVQPREIIGFFDDLVKREGFKMDVAGSLNDGRRIWALVSCGEGAEIIGHDEVRPYLLAATSYDGTMASTFKFTAIRVVCNNTISMATGVAADGQKGGGENDKTEGAVVNCVRVPHSVEFDADKVKLDLGIVRSAFDRFVIQSRLLAEQKVDEKFVVEFLKALLPKPKNEEENVEAGKTFQRLLATWRGDVPSATLPEAQGTAWGLLNAITWDVDHVRGRDGSRLNAAWFGTGEGLKSKALDLLSKVAA
jgi:phage/plasmid-like protein (TIGR03299 family)